ncbi:MAG: HPF/RaiA family ribosome-associated protein [Fibrobacteria bacterium]
MKILVNTDSTISGKESIGDQVRQTIESSLSHVSGHITRIEVYLSDENGKKAGGDDIKCVIEARLEGRPPVAVTHHAANLAQSVDGAADKMSRLIQHTLEKLRDDNRHRTDPAPPESPDDRNERT